MLFLVPLFLILIYSFLSAQQGGGVLWEWTLDHYREVLAPDARASTYNVYVSVTIRSLVLAAVTTFITLVLALPLAVFISRQRLQATKNLLLVGVMIAFWTSQLVRTYALRFLLANTGPLNSILENIGIGRQVFLNTTFAVLLGLVYTTLPFMILPLYAAVERVDSTLLEASRDLGANRRTVFFTVFIPLIQPGIVVGSVMVFVLGVGEYLVPTLLGGGKVAMIANMLELEFGSAGNWPLGSAIAIFYVLLVLGGLRLIVGRDDRQALI
jgi:spermidine/putrescine transport system permease protein